MWKAKKLRLLYGFFCVLILDFALFEVLTYFIAFIVECAILKVKDIYCLWQVKSKCSKIKMNFKNNVFNRNFCSLFKLCQLWLFSECIWTVFHIVLAVDRWNAWFCCWRKEQIQTIKISQAVRPCIWQLEMGKYFVSLRSLSCVIRYD